MPGTFFATGAGVVSTALIATASTATVVLTSGGSFVLPGSVSSGPHLVTLQIATGLNFAGSPIHHVHISSLTNSLTFVHMCL
jgi:hypothetical protein